jgi:hypothetical protein
MALRECGRYPLTTGSIALRTVRTALRGHARPSVRPTLLRLKVLLSFLRLLPTMLGKRRAAPCEIPRRQLQRGLVSAR